MKVDDLGSDPWFLFIFRFARAGAPNGAAVRPAQGNALGIVNRTGWFSTAQRANSSRGEALARWADKREMVLHASQGVALGWVNCRAFGPKATANVRNKYGSGPASVLTYLSPTQCATASQKQ